MTYRIILIEFNKKITIKKKIKYWYLFNSILNNNFWIIVEYILNVTYKADAIRDNNAVYNIIDLTDIITHFMKLY